ncbi:MAG: ATP-binding protein [Janthinobacterium lividum]
MALLGRAGYDARACDGPAALARACDVETGALLLTEESLRAGAADLDAALAAQPPWSEVPVILLVQRQEGLRGNPDMARRALPASALNAIVMERPLSSASLISAVGAALRSRQRQFDMRDRLAELAAGREALEEQVRERTAKLVLQEEALRQSQKMEAVGQLTGGIAHDFNNLLTIIRSSVDLLRRPTLAEDRRRRYLDAVSDTVDRAAKLTGQLLAFARRSALLPEVFDVGARLAAVADLLDTVTGARIKVSVELPEWPCFVHADVSQFETALVNMAVNARDAMDGEGRLTLRLCGDTGLPPIRGHGGSEAPFVSIDLSDTGEGIPPERLARIFEPFFTTKEVGKGTGLGLSQVFGFAKQSGGDIDVISVVGEGTTFTLYLPCVAAPSGAGDAGNLSAPNQGAVPCGEGRRVLIVEDNIEIGRFAKHLLDDLGYHTLWVPNADEALAQLATEAARFDVVFSDVVMPGMSGIDLAHEVRRRYPHLPVVLTSGYSHVLAQEGPHGFDLVHKPYSAEQVSQALNSAIIHN